MATIGQDIVQLETAPPPRRVLPARLLGADRRLIMGVILIVALVLFGALGRVLVSADGMRLGSGPFSKPPTADHLFGTDSAGRDLFTMVVYGTLPTLAIGLIAGGVGTAVGAALGLVTGYYRGPAETLMRTAGDILLAIPTLMVMVVIASFITTGVTTMALIIALFAWPWPARTVRSQTLSLRERQFIDMSRLSGSSGAMILLTDLLPLLLPFIMAGFVGAVSGGILAAVGLQLLGLGPLETPTIGLILHNAFQYAALYRGLWWWWLPPTVMLAILFIGLFLISLSLDEFANPRLRAAQG